MKKFDGEKKRRRFKNRFRNEGTSKNALISAIPNMTTILALCTGFTAVRFALTKQWEMVIGAILLAAILDSLDGRLARLLNSASRFGAELDSLSDFVNFGITPALVLYFYKLQEWGHYGWAVSLFFAVCMGLRLARFNAQSHQQDAPTWSMEFFTGVPAPAAALLGLIPLVTDLAVGYSYPNTVFNTGVCALWTVIVGFLMISTLATFSFKKMQIPEKYMFKLLFLFSVATVLIMTAPWITYLGLCTIYIASWFLSIKKKRRYLKSDDLLI